MSQRRKAYLEITNLCNLSCAFCPGTSRPPHRLSEEEFLILAEKLRPWASYLYFHLMGEPCAHPLLPRFLALANNMGFQTIITTNGTLLPSRADALLQPESRPHKISISLHAFEANDCPIPFPAYLDGCTSFARRAAEAGVITVLRLWNLDGRAEGALHEKNDEILNHLHTVFPDPWTETRSGYRLSDRIFLEWGEKFDWPHPNAPLRSDEGFCYALRDQVGVLSNGTVVPCCLDGDGCMPLGNLFSQTLEEILSSPRAHALYDGFTAHKCSEDLCRRCMRAGYYRRTK
ncbi:MAG: SPASM domain-containing protein [Clostridia bacterium]|nr:SPASM domain-containing protein [Clostridia bacterium]